MRNSVQVFRQLRVHCLAADRRLRANILAWETTFFSSIIARENRQMADERFLPSLLAFAITFLHEKSSIVRTHLLQRRARRWCHILAT